MKKVLAIATVLSMLTVNPVFAAEKQVTNHVSKHEKGKENYKKFSAKEKKQL